MVRSSRWDQIATLMTMAVLRSYLSVNEDEQYSTMAIRTLLTYCVVIPDAWVLRFR